jgi:hypothetical protein
MACSPTCKGALARQATALFADDQPSSDTGESAIRLSGIGAGG